MAPALLILVLLLFLREIACRWRGQPHLRTAFGSPDVCIVELHNDQVGITGVIHYRLLPVIPKKTLETGPGCCTVDSGPEEEKSSPKGATSPSLFGPVGWGLTMETSVSTELAISLTMGADVTVELATSLGTEEQSMLSIAVRAHDWAWNHSSMPNSCATTALDIASTCVADAKRGGGHAAN